MDRATRKRLYNLCDPDEPVGPDDERWVDLDAFCARGHRLIDRLAEAIALSKRPRHERLTAAPGSGVTSELLRLKALLTREHHYLVVFVDASTLLDLWSPIAASDLLLAIVERTQATVTAAAGETAREPPGRLWRWLGSGDPDLGRLSSSPESPVMALRDNPTLRAKLRTRIQAERSYFLREIRDELTLCESRARSLGHEGIAVLVDGIERLRGNTSNWTDVLASAERVFGADDADLELPVHVVYTLPLAAIPRLERPIRILPAIQLFDRQGSRRDAGFEACRAIVERRIPPLILGEFFGVSGRMDVVDSLLTATGGVPREIVRLLQSCIAERSLNEGRLSWITATRRDEYRRIIPESAYPGLAQIHARKTLSAVDAKGAEVVERMLAFGAVLPYADDAVWFDLHPAVQAILPIEHRAAGV